MGVAALRLRKFASNPGIDRTSTRPALGEGSELKVFLNGKEFLVEPRGIEPLTSSLRTTRSPN
jgi:hypothetical protein